MDQKAHSLSPDIFTKILDRLKNRFLSHWSLWYGRIAQTLGAWWLLWLESRLVQSFLGNLCFFTLFIPYFWFLGFFSINSFFFLKLMFSFHGEKSYIFACEKWGIVKILWLHCFDMKRKYSSCISRIMPFVPFMPIVFTTGLNFETLGIGVPTTFPHLSCHCNCYETWPWRSFTMGGVISKAANDIGGVLGNAFVAPVKTIFGASCG